MENPQEPSSARVFNEYSDEFRTRPIEGKGEIRPSGRGKEGNAGLHCHYGQWTGKSLPKFRRESFEAGLHYKKMRIPARAWGCQYASRIGLKRTAGRD